MIKPLSIRAKLLLVLLGLFIVVAGSFAAYARTSSTRYRELRTLEMSQTVAFESERLAGTIAEMDRNAIDLALVGLRYYEFPTLDPEFAESAVVRNISAFPSAIGGGIWYEPHVFSLSTQRVAFYAFRDDETGTVRYDPAYGSPAYDYPNQMWYLHIINVLRNSPEGANTVSAPVTAWTVPYFDDTGTEVLMTTVGAGIIDVSGNLIGMATVDWEIDSMLKRLTEIRPTDGSFILLAAPAENEIIAETATYLDSEVSFSDLDWASDLSSLATDTVYQSTVTIDGKPYLTFSREFDNGWLFSVQVPEREMFADIDARNLHYSLTLGTALTLAVVAAWLVMSKLFSKPLLRLSDEVVRLGADGDLDADVSVSSRDEIGKLATAFNKMTGDLRRSITQRIAALAEKERIGSELSVAHEIQAAILPHTFPAFPSRDEFDIYACMYPQREIGGDFYDFFLVDESTLAIVIADVSGKGVPAALFMMGARTMIRNTVLAGGKPADALASTNNALCENNDAAMFVTAFLGCLDLETGVFSYANAGHNPPILICKAKDPADAPTVSWLKVSAGFVLGGMPGIEYKTGQITLAPGDSLLLYTDGVTEAMNDAHEQYGETRLLNAVLATYGKGVADQCELIRSDVAEFVGSAEPADDLTMLLVRYDGPRNRHRPAPAVDEAKLAEIVIPANLEQLEKVQSFVRDTLTAAACPADICNQVLLAVEEIFVNIAHYAYDVENIVDAAAVVYLRCGVQPNAGVVVEFADAGRPFNPLAEASEPDLSASATDRTVGGLGIFMARQLMSSMDYRHDGERNVLTMTRALAESPPIQIGGAP